MHHCDVPPLDSYAADAVTHDPSHLPLCPLRPLAESRATASDAYFVPACLILTRSVRNALHSPISAAYARSTHVHLSTDRNPALSYRYNKLDAPRSLILLGLHGQDTLYSNKPTGADQVPYSLSSLRPAAPDRQRTRSRSCSGQIHHRGRPASASWICSLGPSLPGCCYL